MKQLLVLLGVITLGVGVACKDHLGNGNGCESTVPDYVIKAQDNLTYDLPTLTVGLQKRICWENSGSTAHSVTALVTVTNGMKLDTLWNVDGRLSPEFIVVASFNTTGDYPYHCRYHEAQGMTGTIQVR